MVRWDQRTYHIGSGCVAGRHTAWSTGPPAREPAVPNHGGHRAVIQRFTEMGNTMLFMMSAEWTPAAVAALIRELTRRDERPRRAVGAAEIRQGFPSPVPTRPRHSRR